MEMKYFHTEMDIELDKDYFEKSAWLFSDEDIRKLQAAYCKGGWEFLEAFCQIVRKYEKEICDNLELFIAFIKRNKFLSYNIPQAYGFINTIWNLKLNVLLFC